MIACIQTRKCVIPNGVGIEARALPVGKQFCTAWFWDWTASIGFAPLPMLAPLHPLHTHEENALNMLMPWLNHSLPLHHSLAAARVRVCLLRGGA